MEILLEILAELLFEASFEASQNKRLSKWIRYPLIAIIVLFFAFAVFLCILAGVLFFKINKLAGIILIAFGIIFLVSGILKLKKLYIQNQEKIKGDQDEQNN